ncbi:MAG TPA: TfoX/Sxy family protein [Polyangiaceae bacterium]|nr:TfoX/Sxy family protein [Polyangiaceae bacterium]
MNEKPSRTPSRSEGSVANKRWQKSSPELVERFKKALPKDAAVEPKSMFGYPAAFVRGNYFAGLFEEQVVIRMPEPQKSALAALAKAGGFNPMGGKPMTDWFVVPAKIASSATGLTRFLKEALASAKELPEKKKAKPKKAKP